MNEDSARRWLSGHFEAAKLMTLERFRTMVVEENARHNLIAPSTVAEFWGRHVVDSAQLLHLAPQSWKHWADIGSGAGFPGLVVAILQDRPVTLIEPRKLRASFLEHCAAALELPKVEVLQSAAEKVKVQTRVDVISARAVAPLDKLFMMSAGLASTSTTYIFPKGTKAREEVEVAQHSWLGTFHVEQSVTGAASGIVVASGVSPK
jgi:16S rRNA (guanine527-N7)-methyltransferase